MQEKLQNVKDTHNSSHVNQLCIYKATHTVITVKDRCKRCLAFVKGLPEHCSTVRFADWVIGVVHLPERTETGGPHYHIGPGCADRA